MFDVAINKVLKHEGLYSNDPHDMGAETYRGISRRYHPNWSGWSMIDEYKSSPNFIAIIKSSERLKELTIEYYRANFWDSNIKPLGITDNSINRYIFDMSVNIGSWAKIVQKAINKRLKQSDRDKLVVDGNLGAKSKKALKEVCDEAFVIALIEYRVKHYTRLATRNPTQMRYLFGWINRSFEI
jgi:lysozyme family protein